MSAAIILGSALYKNQKGNEELDEDEKKVAVSLVGRIAVHANAHGGCRLLECEYCVIGISVTN